MSDKKLKMGMKVKHVGGAYGKPLSNRVGKELTGKDLDRFGELMVKHVVAEARKAAGKSRSIPRTEKFFESFSYRIKGSRWGFNPIRLL